MQRDGGARVNALSTGGKEQRWSQLAPTESCSLNNNMIIKMALAKDRPECVLDRSLGASVGGECGGLTLPEDLGSPAGTWQRQGLNLSLFDSLDLQPPSSGAAAPCIESVWGAGSREPGCSPRVL